MKKYIFSAFLVMLTLFSANSIMAQEPDNKNNYVILTTTLAYLKPAIITAETLKMEDGQNFGDFQIIIYGKEVADVIDTGKMTQFIEQAEKVGVQIGVCEMALNKFKVDKTKLPKEIKIVGNTFLHNFQLQNKGYKSISL